MLPAGGHAAANHKVPCFEAEEVHSDADPVEALWAVITTVRQCESALVVIEPLEAVLGADRERIKGGELQVGGEAQFGGCMRVGCDILSRHETQRCHGISIPDCGNLI